MPIICDCHVHLYPHYDLKRALNYARNNLNKLAPKDAIKVICLTERFDCHYFKKLSTNEINVEGVTFNLLDPQGLLVAHFTDADSIYIFAGRQVVTKERLELLALTKDVEVVDGLPYESAIMQINQQGALAVVNWAPGKWFGKRGTLVAEIIERYSSEEVAFCDTTLRFRGWPKPYLMKVAHQRHALLAGSDPLPVVGEEIRIGSYGVYFKQEDQACLTVSNFKALLANYAIQPSLAGSRPGVLDFATRMYRYYSSEQPTNSSNLS